MIDLILTKFMKARENFFCAANTPAHSTDSRASTWLIAHFETSWRSSMTTTIQASASGAQNMRFDSNSSTERPSAALQRILSGLAWMAVSETGMISQEVPSTCDFHQTRMHKKTVLGLLITRTQTLPVLRCQAAGIYLNRSNHCANQETCDGDGSTVKLDA